MATAPRDRDDAAMRARSRIGWLLLSSLPFAACASDRDAHWARHTDGDVWAAAFATQVDRPERLLPALGLLEASVAFGAVDRQVQSESTEDAPLTAGNTQSGDATAIGLAALAGGLSLGECLGGDDGHALEVLLESFVAVDGTTEILKHSLRRQRPDHSARDSFPSGHTSFAFTMATLLARRIDDLGDSGWDKLGYLAYLPAAYVGIDRSEANRHWPSDVAFGAFLGVLLTNVVYDAHYGNERHAGLFAPRARAAVALEPTFDGDTSRLEFVLRW